MDKKIYIILVNYNGYKDTIECLESLKKLDYKNYQIIITDNNSSDQSIENICQWAYEKKVDFILYSKQEAEEGGISDKEKLISNPLILIDAQENDGFAAGNNIALKYALKKDDFEYIWLLNNDTIVDKNALKELVKGIEKYENVGAVGSKILYYDRPELLQNVGSKIVENSFFRLCKPILDLNKENIDTGQYDYDFDVNDIMGASLLVKKEVIASVGLMPEEYFLYGEETDWNFNIQKHGYKLMTIYRSKIFHKKSRATGGDQSSITLYYRTRNQFILNKKYMQHYKYYLFIMLYLIKKIIILKQLNRKCRKVVTKALLDGLKNRQGKL